MKLFISGSPRTKNCYQIIKDIMNVSDAFMPLSEMQINYCKGCDLCQNDEEKAKCVMEDDMLNFYENIDNFDTLVFVSPIYFNQITALMKTFIDRLNPYIKTNKLFKKKIFLILTGEEVIEKNETVISEINMYFEKLSLNFETDFKKTYYFQDGEYLHTNYIEKIMEIKGEIYK